MFIVYTIIACSDGDVLLVNQGSESGFSGAVLVCLNRQYGYICADNWGDREAEVVCRYIDSYFNAPHYGEFRHNNLSIMPVIMSLLVLNIIIADSNFC